MLMYTVQGPLILLPLEQVYYYFLLLFYLTFIIQQKDSEW